MERYGTTRYAKLKRLFPIISSDNRREAKATRATKIVHGEQNERKERQLPGVHAD